jgi:hypothetical protein
MIASFPSPFWSVSTTVSAAAYAASFRAASSVAVDFTNTIIAREPRTSSGSRLALGLATLTSPEPACSIARPSRFTASTCSRYTSYRIVSCPARESRPPNSEPMAPEPMIAIFIRPPQSS